MDDLPTENREEVVLPDGAIYRGQWKNNMKHGKGVQIWPDGAKYEGEWKWDKANGKGKFTHAEGDIYDGEWLNDKVFFIFI